MFSSFNGKEMTEKKDISFISSGFRYTYIEGLLLGLFTLNLAQRLTTEGYKKSVKNVLTIITYFISYLCVHIAYAIFVKQTWKSFATTAK